MSTTRSQKRKNAQREADDNVSEGFVSSLNMENSHPLDQNVELAGPSKPKSPRVENSFLESIRSSLKEEITSEIKTLLLESQKEMLKLLKPETRENIRDHVSEELENETRSFYTPTKTVRINSTQNEDQNIIRNYFHSLLRGGALQAFCNIEDLKKDSLDEIITIFKRRFGDYLSMAKARCEWDALKFDLSTQKLHEFLDVLQKTAKEAFGTEAQQFIEKAIYAKMPDHVKKILNRANLEDKPYNDIVLQLEKEMRLNGLGAPDEVTLVPLNKIEPAQTKTEPKPAETTAQTTKKGYCFYCNKFGHHKAECRKMKRDKWMQTRRNNGPTNHSAGKPPKCDTCGKPHKTEDCWNAANAANDPRTKRHNTQESKRDTSVTQLTNQPDDESKN